MALLDRVLEVPLYGYTRGGELYVPTKKEIFREFFSNLNIFRTKKAWLALWGWTTSMSLLVPLLFFIFKYHSWTGAILGFIYSMCFLGSHGTIYYHRYSTHHAYTFSNSFARFIVRNLVIKIVPEETYVISHYVHHQRPEKPGDPYNVHAGWLYCFLADANHQGISRNLTREDYKKLTHLLDHTGVRLNSYEQYQKWGSLCHPFYTVMHYVLNWTFWFGAFYLMGGMALVTALFGASFVWAMGIRTFNYDGHGGGKDKRREGTDFNRRDFSINQLWPGLVTGEWHNNHHLYPNGARAGFLKHQLDPAWWFIRFYHFIGAIDSYKDFKDKYFADHYNPYLEKKRAAEKLRSPRLHKTPNHTPGILSR